MKYKYEVHATQTAFKEGTITVVARNEEEAETIALESDDWTDWNWDNGDWGDCKIDSIKPIGAVEDEEDEDDEEDEE